MRNFQFWVLALLIFICFHICGCFFGRLDYEVTKPNGEELRVSGTIWTIGKDYSYNDPNTWFSSEADSFNILTPYGTVGTE
jgi:hypothetical protein